MSLNDFIDEQELRKAIAILKPDGQLFEIRILAGKKTLSGYFKDADSLLSALRTVNLRDATVYFTLGIVNEDCYSRQQCNRFVAGASTTADTDIIGYQWFLVDVDPERLSGVSSTDDELKAAGEIGGKVYKHLKDIGFSEPIKALSGNGYHLLYKISLANNQQNADLVHRCLEVLSDLFSNEAASVDVSVANPSRICKMYGTLAQKGSSTEKRPHRMSRIFSTITEAEITPKTYLEKLAGEIPEKPKPIPSFTDLKQEFDLVDFLNRNRIGYKVLNSSGRDGSTIYALDECPFNCAHKDGDSKIFQYSDGAISFLCHHNSCNGKRWQDVRKLFEPNAYDQPVFDTRYEDGWRQHNRNKQKSISYDVQETETDSDMFRTAEEIWNDDEPQHEFILSGIDGIDRTIHGLQKQSISMISGLRASGKSTLIGNIILKAVDDEHTVCVYSGELSNKKYLNWLSRQAAGRNFVEASTKYENGYGVNEFAQKKIISWMGSRFWLYNNKCGNDFRKIANSLRQILKEKQADLCVIDNLMALDLSALDRDKYEAQTKFVWELKEIAELTNTHILFVAHPKKASGLIRLEDVSGTGNITNIVDNAFMVHRHNMDFKKRFKETFGEIEYNKNIPEQSTNIIEIAKDRENGTMDYFIPLYFEPESKRMKNEINELIHYSWEPDESRPLQFDDTLDSDLPF